MSQTATRIPLATAGLALVLASAPVGVACDSTGVMYGHDSCITEEIVARAIQGERDLAAVAEITAWERLSDELSADIGWE